MRRERPMLLFLIVIIVLMVLLSPSANRLAKEMERRRIEREIETEQLRQEFYNQVYADYMSRKNKK